MNGSPNLGTADKSLSGLNAAIIWAEAMVAMDTHGHGHGQGWNNNGGRGGQSQNNGWSVNETSTGDRVTAPAQGTEGSIPSTVSTASQSQASNQVGNDRGGQNKNQFGSNRP